MEYINGYKAEESLYTKDGKEISVLRLEVENEEKVLDEWATHFREQYRYMEDLDFERHLYLACGATDLRKSYHGLAAIIKLKFKLDPYSRCMFAFCNRRRTSIKILQWDGSGFWILMKRLDRDSFHWPDTPDELQKVTLKEMHWLCDGLSLTPKGAFEERHPKIVV